MHSRITTIPALGLQRFPNIEVRFETKGHRVYLWQGAKGTPQKLGLRQNQISDIDFPPTLGKTLKDLDLYDNLISHIKGLDSLTSLESLDLSYNKIKHIKGLERLEELKDLYFVQNKISKIEGLDRLKKLRNLELGGNRIRVSLKVPS